jgi:hypothetical protein
MKEFASGDTIITFYFERALKGEKSNLMGFYPHPNSPEDSTDHVHFTHSCLEKCFSPVDNPFMYDLLADMVRQEILEDESDKDDFPDIEFEDDLPYCLWCKRTDTVWMQHRVGGEILHCVACNKLWDNEEVELRWDPVNSIYVDVDR